VEIVQIWPEVASTRDDTLTVQHRDQLERGFRRLSPEQRAVLVLHHYVGLTLSEVAERLEIPEGTAKSKAALRGVGDAGGPRGRFPCGRGPRGAIGVTTQRDPYADQLVSAFLDEGPARMSDRLFDAIVDDVYRTRQRGPVAPWRYIFMNRPALATAVIVVAIAVAGAAAVLYRPNEARIGTEPSPPPATPMPAVGTTLPPPGSLLLADTFSEPFSYTMPAFPVEGTAPITGEAFDPSPGGQPPAIDRAYRVFSNVWGSVTFHDDESLPADMCRPSGSSIDDVPATPDDVGRWLQSAVGLLTSAPVTMTVDGRPAMVWDTQTGGHCDDVASRLPPWFGADERHRIYAVPTGSDTILVITWGVDWGNGSEEHLDGVNAATDELVRSMKFDSNGGA
jgi:hypothetical protein